MGRETRSGLGRRRKPWKATLRKGEERAEFLAAISTSEDVVQSGDRSAVHRDEPNDYRRLRLKAPKDGGIGLAMLDDSLRGRETTYVLTAAQALELSATLSGAKARIF
jgi:hypothetical protein